MTLFETARRTFSEVAKFSARASAENGRFSKRHDEEIRKRGVQTRSDSLRNSQCCALADELVDGCPLLRGLPGRATLTIRCGSCVTTIAVHTGDIPTGTLHKIKRDLEPA